METAAETSRPGLDILGDSPKGSRSSATLPTLPGDDLRQIMWRFANRFDMQMAVQAARSVARGPVAQLVQQGERSTHEWTEAKNSLLKAFDESGITAAGLDVEFGGYIEGPKNLLLSLIAFELAWVDGGAATCSLATNLALAPIIERGTAEQREHYMRASAPPPAGDNRPVSRGAFVLTEPLPYVGVETGLLSGKIRVAEWADGKEPILHVEKRGRFITNMDFASYATAAVETDDPRIKSSCMVILEEGDDGAFDRGAVTKKLVHQLSSTRDPIFNLKVPASRIIGGYQIKDGVIVPNYTHSEVIEAVFRRTRVPVGLMTSAKLLSAVEPVIRYQRNRFRGAESLTPGTPRYELGLQQKEDALLRLVDVCALGEAGASLGFATARLLDEFDQLDHRRDAIFAEHGADTARARLKVVARYEPEVLEFIALRSKRARSSAEEARLAQLQENELIQYLHGDAMANILAPAVKLWNTSNGVGLMRQAVTLMGGYGITEDCPGFLPLKWMDAQLEATYEGPESVQRRHLAATMTNEIFLSQFRSWIKELRGIANIRPGTGACTVATAMQLWLHSIDYLRTGKDADGVKLFNSNRQGATFPMADALCWLLAARYLIMDALELEVKGPENPVVAEGLDGYLNFYTDLCHVVAAQAAGEVGRTCAELVFGYQRHLSWSSRTSNTVNGNTGNGNMANGGTSNANACYSTQELAELESTIAGIESQGTDVLESDCRPPKAGPCFRFAGYERFCQLRTKLDGCVVGCRLAKDRAAVALTKVMIPETLDYPS